MKKKVSVGIVGCGTIGTALTKIITSDFAQKARVAYLCDSHREKTEKLRVYLKKRRLNARIVSLDALIQKSDLIVEAASGFVSGKLAREVLVRNKQAIIMSTGGLLHPKALETLMRRSSGKIWVPSGAVAGIDGLLAARESGIRRVKLITRKPPEGLRGAPHFEKNPFPVLRGRKEYRVFRGSAAAAIRAFPKNVNIAAVISLAGIGFQKTQVEIWTSRAFKRNRHELVIDAVGGRMRLETYNVPSAMNPKTSAMAVYSAAAMLRKIFTRFRVGT